MVFSFPNYLDHPNLHQFNQHQEHHHHQLTGAGNHHLQPLPPPPPPLVVGGVGGAGSIRPGSMVDRARTLKMPPPEAGAKCPRCDSTNTKFCYYNNYNLSQPRHFCKGCRRYWTKGGALRNVPVGGGCRRNKRSKSSGSCSSSKCTAGDERQIGTSNNNNSTNSGPMSPSIRGGTTNMAGHHFQQASTQIPLMAMAALPNFDQYSGSQVHGLADIRFNIGSNNLSLTSGSAEPPVWMLPSFQGGFDAASNPPTNLFQFQREGVEEHHQLPPMAGSSNDTSSVKMENHQNRNQELNLSRHFLDSSSAAPQQNWSANAWSNGFSSLNSSSSSHLL